MVTKLLKLIPYKTIVYASNNHGPLVKMSFCNWFFGLYMMKKKLIHSIFL
jgi:hypothetical protein